MLLIASPRKRHTLVTAAERDEPGQFPACAAPSDPLSAGLMLDTLYARLRRCGDVACTGRPFTEHSSFPVLTVSRRARRGRRR